MPRIRRRQTVCGTYNGEGEIERRLQDILVCWGEGTLPIPPTVSLICWLLLSFSLFITLWLIYKHYCPFHSFCEDLLQIHYLCSKAGDKHSIQFRYFIECKRNELQCELVGVVRLCILCKFCKTHYRRRGNITLIILLTSGSTYNHLH